MPLILQVGPRGRVCTAVQYWQQGRHLEYPEEIQYAYAAVGFQWVLFRGAKFSQQNVNSRNVAKDYFTLTS